MPDEGLVDDIYTSDAGRWDDQYGVLFVLIVASMLLYVLLPPDLERAERIGEF